MQPAVSLPHTGGSHLVALHTSAAFTLDRRCRARSHQQQLLDHRQPALRRPDRPRCGGRLDDGRGHSGARLGDQRRAVVEQDPHRHRFPPMGGFSWALVFFGALGRWTADLRPLTILLLALPWAVFSSAMEWVVLVPLFPFWQPPFTLQQPYWIGLLVHGSSAVMYPLFARLRWMPGEAPARDVRFTNAWITGAMAVIAMLGTITLLGSIGYELPWTGRDRDGPSLSPPHDDASRAGYRARTNRRRTRPRSASAQARDADGREPDRREQDLRDLVAELVRHGHAGLQHGGTCRHAGLPDAERDAAGQARAGRPVRRAVRRSDE